MGYLIRYRHREISAPVVLDTFPSKKIRHHYRTVSAGGEDRMFYLQTKIRKGDVLAFGQFSTFAEVFDIGNLVYDRQKTKSGNFPDAKIPEPIPIMLRNVQVKYDTIPKPVSSRYFSLTDKAQQAILKNQFAKAATIYDSLNTEFRYIFARDMHNALRANALSRRYSPAIKWAEKLVEKGMKPEYFTPRIFDKLRNTTEWKRFLKRYPEHFEKSKAAFDINYAKRLEAIVDFDQSEYIRNSKGESSPEKLAETTQEANRRFIEFVEKTVFLPRKKWGSDAE